jgi:hypothetical protein
MNAIVRFFMARSVGQGIRVRYSYAAKVTEDRAGKTPGRPAAPTMREQIFLRNHVTAADVLAAASTLLRAKPDKYIEATEDTPYEIQLVSPERPGSQIRFIDNKQIGVRYVKIDGPQAAAVRAELEPALPHYDAATAYERATTEPGLDESITALFHLALARGPIPEPQVLRLIGQLLLDPNDALRQAAVVACAYFEWPDVLPMLEDLITREPNGRTRDDARLVISRLRAQPEGRHQITGFERIDVHAGSVIETVWVHHEHDNAYRIASMPERIYNLSINDAVLVDTWDALKVLVSIERKSDHRTLWVATGANPRRIEEVDMLMRPHRVRVEEQRVGRVAIDVPPYIAMSLITADLDGANLSWEIADPQPAQPTPHAPFEGKRKKR